MWDYDSDININLYNGEKLALHYKWFKLTNDQFPEQDDF